MSDERSKQSEASADSPGDLAEATQRLSAITAQLNPELVHDFFQRLRDWDQRQLDDNHKQLLNFQERTQKQLKQVTTTHERALKLHSSRQRMLEDEINTLRSRLEEYRNQIIERDEDHARLKADRDRFSEEYRRLERTLASLRLELAAEQSIGRTTTARFKDRTSKLMPLLSGGEDDTLALDSHESGEPAPPAHETSIATPRLQPVEIKDAEHLAVEVAQLRNENDKLRQDLNYMQDIISGSGSPAIEVEVVSPEMELRAKAAEETCKALNLTLEHMRLESLDPNKFHPVLDLIATTLRAPLDKPEALVAHIEDEQNRWRKNLKRLEEEKRKVEERFQDLRDEHEEAMRHVDMLRQRSQEDQRRVNDVEGELEKLQSDLEDNEKKLESLDAELQAKDHELAMSRETMQRSVEELAQNLKQKDVQSFDKILQKPLVLLDEWFTDQFQSDYMLLRNTLDSIRDEHDREIQDIVELAFEEVSARDEHCANLDYFLGKVSVEAGRFEQSWPEMKSRIEAYHKGCQEQQLSVDESRKLCELALTKVMEQSQNLLEYERQVTEVSQELNESSEKTRQLRQGVEILEQERGRIENEKTYLANMVKESLERLNAISRERSELSESLEARLLELARLEDEIASCRAAEPRDEERLRALETQRQNSTHLKTQLEESVQLAKNTEVEANKSYDQFEQALAAVQEKNKGRKSELWEAQTQLNEAKLREEALNKRLSLARDYAAEQQRKLVLAREALAGRHQAAHESHECQRKMQRRLNLWSEKLRVARKQAEFLQVSSKDLSAKIFEWVDEGEPEGLNLGSAAQMLQESSQHLADWLIESRQCADLGQGLVPRERLRAMARSVLESFIERAQSEQNVRRSAIGEIMQRRLLLKSEQQALEAKRQSGELSESQADAEQRVLAGAMSELQEQLSEMELSLGQLAAVTAEHRRGLSAIRTIEESGEESSSELESVEELVQSLIDSFQNQQALLTLLDETEAPDGGLLLSQLRQIEGALAGEEPDLERVAVGFQELAHIFQDADDKKIGVIKDLRALRKSVSVNQRSQRELEGQAQRTKSERSLLLDAATFLFEELERGRRQRTELEDQILSLRQSSSGYVDEIQRLQSGIDEERARGKSLAEQLEVARKQLESAVPEEVESPEIKANVEALKSKLAESEEVRERLTRRLSQVKAESDKNAKELEESRKKSESAQAQAQKVLERREKQLDEIRREKAKAGDAEDGTEFETLIKRQEREIRKLKIFLESERDKIKSLTAERSRLKEHIASGRYSSAKLRDRLSLEERRTKLFGKTKKGGGRSVSGQGRPSQKLTNRVVRGAMSRGSGRGVSGQGPVDARSQLIDDLQDRLKRSESRERDLTMMLKRERKRRQEAEGQPGAQAAPANRRSSSRLAKLQLQLQQMEVRLKREASARVEVEKSSQSKLEDLARQLKAAEKNLQSSSKRVQDLESEVAKREKRALTSSAEAVRLGRELEDARSRLASKERELKKSRVELSDNESRVKSLQDSLVEAQQRLVNAEGGHRSVQELEASVEAAKREASQATTRIQEMAQRLVDEEKRRDELEREVSQVEARAEDLSRKLQESGVINKKNIDEVARLNEELEGTRQSLVDREQALSEAEISLAQKNSAVSELEYKLEKARDQLAANEEEARVAVETIEGELDAAREEVRQRSVQLEEMSSQLEMDQALHEDLEKTAAFAQELVQRVAELQENINQKQLDMAVETRNLSSGKDQLEKEEKKHEELQVLAEDAGETLKKIETELMEIDAERGQQLSERESLVSELKAAKAEDKPGIEERLKKIDESLSDLEERQNRLSNKLSEASGYSEHLQQNLAKARESAELQRLNLAEAEQILQTKLDDASTLSEELKEAQTKLEEVAERKLQIAQDLLSEDGEKSIEQIVEELQAEREKREFAQAQANELGLLYQEELKKLRTELAASHDALETREHELSQTHDRLRRVETEVESLQRQVEEGRQALSEAETAYAEASRETGDDESSDLVQARAQLTELRDQVRSRDDQLQEALDEALLQKEVASRLEEALAQARAEVEEFSGKAKRAERETDTSRAWLMKLTDDLEKTRDDFKRTRHDLESMKVQQLEVSVQRDKEHERRRRAEERLHEAEGEIAGLKTRLEEKHKALEQAQVRLSDAESVHAESGLIEDTEAMKEMRQDVEEAASDAELLRDALRSAQEEIRSLRRKHKPTKIDRFKDELLHWLVSKPDVKTLDGGSLAGLRSQLQSRRQNLESQLATGSNSMQDTRATWEVMQVEMDLSETEDLLSWIPSSLQDAEAEQTLTADFPNPAASLSTELESRRSDLEKDIRRMTRAFNWAKETNAPTNEIENKIKEAELRLHGLPQAPESSDKVSDEFLNFYEQQLDELRREIQGLKLERKQQEREAMVTFNTLNSERADIERELEETREKVVNLDQIILTMQTANPGAQVDNLSLELSEMRNNLQAKNFSIQELEAEMEREQREAQRRLEERTMTIERLQGMIEQLQTRNSELQQKLETVLGDDS